MAFIRKVKTPSGATAVQIAYKIGGRIVKIIHIGSAHNKEELDMSWMWEHGQFHPRLLRMLLLILSHISNIPRLSELPPPKGRRHPAASVSDRTNV